MKRFFLPVLLCGLIVSLPVFGSAGTEDADGWKTVAVSGLVFRWRVNGDELDCSVRGATTGWIAVGFNSSARMNGANIIIGYVDKKGVRIEDHYGKGHGHNRDKVGHIRNGFGEEVRGQTEIRFTIPLDSGDPQDFRLEPGRPVFVIMAAGKKDSFSGRHTKRASV